MCKMYLAYQKFDYDEGSINMNSNFFELVLNLDEA